jgi:ABC-type multidrug transport system ATPase subunit
MNGLGSSVPAVRVEGVVKRFGATVALDGAGLEVPQGMVFGLLGLNGAGKTTLVRILATLLTPDAGRAEVFGRDVVRDPAAVRDLIALTGQFAAVDELLTGRENLEMFGRLFNLSGSRPIAAPVSCSSGSTWPRRLTGRPGPTPAACAAGSTSRRAC